MPKTKKKMKKKTATVKKNKAVKTKKKSVKTTQRKAKRSPKKKVLSVPKGYNSITPYLIVNNGIEAIEFYKKVFGAKEVMRMQKSDNKIAHAELKIGDAKIMLADEFPEMNALAPQAYGGSPISIYLYIKNVDAVVEHAVKSGAKLLRPVANMFYGDRSGVVEDPYGHKWSISTHVEDVSFSEMKKRAGFNA